MLPQISSLLLVALSLPLPPTTAVRASQSPAPTPTPTPAPTIDLGYAQYQGLINASTGVASYLGIRFAQPPIQDLRWRAPQAPTTSPAPGAQNATAAPPLCPQAPLRLTTPGGIPPPDTSNVSEDCLFLKYVPTPRFMAGKAVKAGGVLNAGLLDQEFALKWVQQHNALLAITNSNEGVIFVNQSTADSVTAAQFARNVFPRLGPAQALEAARLYEGLGPPIEQANRIMGETIFQCPTLWFARAFRQSFKGQYAVGPALHGDDISQYFPRFWESVSALTAQ
ncbi:hypothetical protein EYR36_003700 [Pleurotus pulmonarius]|nr:hypothetical protein EYR36_003700 [Pleurotus pulmonarius]